jgi:hypothetical protein
LAVIPVAALCAAVLGAAPAGAASTTTVSDVTLSTNAVSVSGLGVALVTVSAHITSPTPAMSGVGCGNANDPSVMMTRTSVGGQATRPAWFPLLLTAGTETDGIWTATVSVSAAWDGTWQLATIFAASPPSADAGGASCGDVVWQAPVGDPSYALAVTGINRPRLTYTWTPDPAPYDATTLTVAGRLTLQDGSPVPGQNVVITATCQGGAAEDATVTDATGRFTAVRTMNGVLMVCIDVTSYLAAGAGQIQYAHAVLIAPRLVKLSAAIAPPRVVLGRSVDVGGSVLGTLLNYRATLQLQRYAAGRWHDVHAHFRTDGSRYRFHTIPPARGNVRYRVYLPAGSDTVTGAHPATASPVLLVGVL